MILVRYASRASECANRAPVGIKEGPSLARSYTSVTTERETDSASETIGVQGSTTFCALYRAGLTESTHGIPKSSIRAYCVASVVGILEVASRTTLNTIEVSLAIFKVQETNRTLKLTYELNWVHVVHGWATLRARSVFQVVVFCTTRAVIYEII